MRQFFKGSYRKDRKKLSVGNMKLNAEKCEFLITGHRLKHLWLNVGETQFWEKISGQVTWHNN